MASSDVPLPELVGVPEIAQMLGVSQQWVYDQKALGRIPHYKLNGKLLRFDPDEVLRHFASRDFHNPRAAATVHRLQSRQGVSRHG